MLIRKTMNAMLAVGAMVIATAASAQQEAKILKFLSTPFGTGAYVIGAALEDVSRSNHPWLRIVAMESPGGVFNVRRINALPQEGKEDTITLFSFVTPIAAQNGIGPFSEKLPENFVALGFSWNLVLFFATQDPEIKSLSDLKGKSLGVGFRTQDSWGFLAAALAAHGSGAGQDIDIQYVGLGESRDAFLNGNIDAIVVGGYVEPETGSFIPTPATQQLLAAGRDLTFISVDAQAVERTSAALDGIPALSYTLPAGSIENHDEPIDGSFVGVAWWASDQLPDDLAYEFTKLVIDNAHLLGGYHALGDRVTPQSLTWPIRNVEGIPVHPASLRAMQDAGLLD